MLDIYIDADACPVKDEIYRVAARYGLRVFVVANGWLRTPSPPRPAHHRHRGPGPGRRLDRHPRRHGRHRHHHRRPPGRPLRQGRRPRPRPHRPPLHPRLDRHRPRHPQPDDHLARHRPDPRHRPPVHQAGPLTVPGGAGHSNPGGTADGAIAAPVSQGRFSSARTFSPTSRTSSSGARPATSIRRA